MGQSWWKCEQDVWGGFGRILMKVCGAELVEL